MNVSQLREWGANVDEGLVRCLNSENFYLTLAGKAVQDKNFGRLEETCAAGNLDEAFDAAHSLKGMLANLALTPILRPVETITELLRARTETDYAPLLQEIGQKREELVRML